MDSLLEVWSRKARRGIDRGISTGTRAAGGIFGPVALFERSSINVSVLVMVAMISMIDEYTIKVAERGARRSKFKWGSPLNQES